MPGYSEADRRLAEGLGGRVRSRREELGMSTKELQAATKLASGDNLSAIERGRNLPRPLLLVQIAQALGVTTDYLLGVSKKKPQTSGGLDSYTAGYRACLHDVQDKLAELDVSRARRRTKREAVVTT